MLGAAWGVATAHLALAYALGHPNLASIVFGATDPDQVRANIGAVDAFESLDAGQRATIDTLA